MPRLLLPVWVDRATSIFLIVTFLLLFFKLYLLAMLWFYFGVNQLEEDEEVVDEEEEDVDEEDLHLFDLIIEYNSRGKVDDPLGTYRALMDTYDIHFADSFRDPPFDYMESVDLLLIALDYVDREEREEQELEEFAKYLFYDRRRKSLRTY